ncbi:hypothetical protein CDAR_220441 [Caerostris darwini]|uniref:Uncharacterized protein n=1 Tax=Caerostris darwini TaxID=1538125 RepID=A0AAV4UFZ4_9ARAC|nr:hypothetical protein CDAR_220441 [Caerostris darwini]
MRSAPNASDRRTSNEEGPLHSPSVTPGNRGIKEIFLSPSTNHRIEYQSIPFYQQTQIPSPSPSALSRGDNSPRNEYPPMPIKTHAVSLWSPPHVQQPIYQEMGSRFY